MIRSGARSTVLIAVCAVAAASLTACGSDSSGGESGRLTVAGPYQITGLDPQGTLSADNGTQLAAQQIFDSLVRRSGSEYVPDLATSWKAMSGGKVWTFQLRKGVTYSDGTALKASDVAASVARVVSLKGPLASLWDGIKVAAPSAAQVTFTSGTAQGALLSKVSTLSVLPAAKVGRSGFFSKPIGSGAFRVDSFSPGESLTLSPNPKYWGAKPKTTKVVIRYIGTTAALVTALKTGEVQATWGLPDDQVAQLDGQNGIVTKTVDSNAQYTMWFNSGRSAFAKSAVRKALWQAVDFPKIVKALYPTTGAAARAPIARTVLGYAAQTPYAHDPKAAKAALSAAGFDFGKSYQLAYSGPAFTQFAQSVASDLAKIGVKVTPTNKEKAVYLEDLLALKWDINLQALGDATGDPDYILGRLYTCAAKRTGYCNRQLDTVLSRAATTVDEQQRNTLYAQAQRTIWGEAVGMYPMDVRIAYNWRSGVNGLTPSPNYQPNLALVSVS